MPHPRFGAGFLFRKRQAPVAQLDRALDYESRGQEFESLRARHYLFEIDTELLSDFPALDLGLSRGSTGATPASSFDFAKLNVA